MKGRLLLLSLLLLISEAVSAQILPYAKEIVRTLTSEDFKGRGYVANGDKIAAEYIRSKFMELGVLPFNGGYYQTFTTSVNTFPGAVHLSVNGKPLEAGKHFLVTPGSGPVSGTYNALTLSNDDFRSSMPASVGYLGDKSFLVVEPFDPDQYTPEEAERIRSVRQFLKYGSDPRIPNTIFLSNDKLTWSGSRIQTEQSSLTLLQDSISQPVETIEVDIEASFRSAYETQNVLGFIPGRQTDSLIVLMAHYDHFGMLGEAMFPGANDNASGVAMLLSLARYYAENQPEFTTVFIAFGAEEIGLVGSGYFVRNSPFELDNIKFLLNFDLAGTGDEGIQVVNGSVYQQQFDRLQFINEQRELLPQVKIRGAACNSDHCAFDEYEVPGFYIYTLGGIKAYHDIYDRYETLPLTEFEDYFRLITLFLDGI